MTFEKKSVGSLATGALAAMTLTLSGCGVSPARGVSPEYLRLDAVQKLREASERLEAESRTRSGAAEAEMRARWAREAAESASLTKAALEANRNRYKADSEERARIIAEADERAKELAKRPGVRIGMSTKAVRASSWGSPESVNRTTTANGVREQWIYGSRSYLYFTNGVLTAIQN